RFRFYLDYRQCCPIHHQLLSCATPHYLFLFLYNTTPNPDIHTLSLHDALPISIREKCRTDKGLMRFGLLTKYEDELDKVKGDIRSEEHTSELQSRFDLVCRLLLEKKKMKCWVSVINRSIVRQLSGSKLCRISNA